MIPKPGMLAPGHEKAFAKGVRLYVGGQAEQALDCFIEAAAKDEKGRALADDLFAGLLLTQLERGEEAIPYLETVVSLQWRCPTR